MLTADDLPVAGKYDALVGREVGARELYEDLKQALKNESPYGMFWVLARVREHYGEHARAYADLVERWLSGGDLE